MSDEDRVEECRALASTVRSFRHYATSAGHDLNAWRYDISDERVGARHAALFRGELGQAAKLEKVEAAYRVNARFLDEVARYTPMMEGPSGQGAEGEDGSMDRDGHGDAKNEEHGDGCDEGCNGHSTTSQGILGFTGAELDSAISELDRLMGVAQVGPAEAERVRCVLRSFAREWSADGVQERAACFAPVIDRLCELFPAPERRRRPPRVVVPGCGLARMLAELVLHGFDAQGNEFSFAMLLGSSWVLNGSASRGVEQGMTIHPWCSSGSNHARSMDMFRGVRVPDLHIGKAVEAAWKAVEDWGEGDGGEPPLRPGSMSMAAGDFLDVYSEASGEEGQWDAVATVFFIDTAHDVVAYLERIFALLRPGGAWVNFGPLLYHYSENRVAGVAGHPSDDSLSVELSLEQVLRAAELAGFVRQGDVQMRPCPYTANPKGMARMLYTCAFFTMIKPA